MEITAKDLFDKISLLDEAEFINELKETFMLGNTNEFDNFMPDGITENDEAYNIYKKACCLYVGHNTKLDRKEAKRIWEIAGSKGEGLAYVELSAFEFAKGNIEDAVNNLLASYKNCCSVGAFRLAICLINGINFDKNEGKAVSILKMISSANYSDGMFLLSKYYRNGLSEIIEKDEKEADRLFEIAYKLGSKYAVYEKLIEKIRSDKEITKDEFNLMVESADDGEARAQYVVGVCYGAGLYTNVDESLAKAYIGLSAKNDLDVAKQLYASLQ